MSVNLPTMPWGLGQTSNYSFWTLITKDNHNENMQTLQSQNLTPRFPLTPSISSSKLSAPPLTLLCLVLNKTDHTPSALIKKVVNLLFSHLKEDCIRIQVPHWLYMRAFISHRETLMHRAKLEQQDLIIGSSKPVGNAQSWWKGQG